MFEILFICSCIRLRSSSFKDNLSFRYVHDVCSEKNQGVYFLDKLTYID